MYATDFEFDGTLLSSKGYMICTFDSDSNKSVSSGADITFKTVKPTGSSKFYLSSANYDSAFTTSFYICKIPEVISSQDDSYLSVADISTIQRWLCKKKYKKFKVDQDGYERIYWNGTFSTQQYLINGRTAGMSLTLTTDAPFAYEEKLNNTFVFNVEKDSPFSVENSSDEEGFIHPDMKITILESGLLTLSNSMDNKIFKIANCDANEVITIDGENCILTSTKNHIEKDSNFYYPKLINTDGEYKNTYTTSLNCTIEFSYAPIRKIGI